MRSSRYTITAVLFLLFFSCCAPCFGQLGFTPNIKKPKEFDNRVLRSEKSDQKKFKLPTRFIQNTVTHYNYFFNANNKLNEVIERAKSVFREDYASLLPFYNYSLDVTAADSIQLDSISYKAQTGIVLHDLRDDWIDNLYLLWGASFYLGKQFDSARMMFQFINYAFADKEKDGYYLFIGSRQDGNDATSISTKEKTSLTKRLLSEPPSRNDAFIWQIRTYLAQDKFSDASTLILSLRHDPNFPSRLRDDLEEVQAFYFYKQQNWDSCIVHLQQALTKASNRLEKARWEYLLAQLNELSNRPAAAQDYYAKVVSHTTDPVMEVWARLCLIRVNKDGGDNYIQKNIDALEKMARRDKYSDYRDIIYYMAAQMELDRNNTDKALVLLLKSVKYASNNPGQRNRAFLQLGDLSYGKHLYRPAYNFYDSVRLDDPSLKNPKAITARKEILGQLATNMETIQRQDSLQRIAALSEGDRKALVKKLVRQIRRQEGLKDESAAYAGSGFEQTPPVNLFSSNDNKGDWYFYNTDLRQKGLSDFKLRWGIRPNSDNWRRSAALNSVIRNNTVADNNGLQTGGPTGNAKEEAKEITFESLYANLPLTPAMLQKSNDSIALAMFQIGHTCIQELEDCDAGTKMLEELRTRFPEFPQMNEVLFNLYYCYHKNGVTAQADEIKKLMADKYPKTNFTAIVATGKDPNVPVAEVKATKTYEGIYDLFIEGNFSQALAEKKKADSVYGNNYWTPQLLYIESVYYIKQHDDSTAKVVLGDLIGRFRSTPIGNKAANLLDVLNRRKEIEEELRNLVVNRPADDTTHRTYSPAPSRTVTTTNRPDSALLNQPLALDTALGKQVQALPMTITAPKAQKDTINTHPAKQPPVISNGYSYNADEAQYVVVVLNKVDPVFVSEARNAFARYNKDTYFNRQMQAELVDVDNDNKLLLISPFKNMPEALDYIDHTRPVTANEIIPWLKGGKYSFLVVSEKNLSVLQQSKDIDKYKQFLNQYLPGKF